MIAAILVFIVVILVVFFSVQNAKPVVISFLLWKFEASLSIIILLTVLSSVIITIIAVSSWSMKRTFKRKKKAVGGDGTGQ